MKNKLTGSQIYAIVVTLVIIYVCFVRLENLVYQNNLFIIIYSNTIGNHQHSTYNTQSAEY